MPQGNHPGEPMAKKYKKSIEKRRRHRKLLKHRGEPFIEGVLEELPFITRKDLFSSTKQTDVAQIRHIVYALLFHIVLHGKNRISIADYCGVTITPVKDGLKEVDRAIRGSGKPLLKRRLEIVCRRFKLEPWELQLGE